MATPIPPRPPARTVRLVIRLSPEEAAELDRVAAEHGRRRSSLVRWALTCLDGWKVRVRP